MRIAHYSSKTWPAIGGAERQLQQLLPAQRELGHETVLITSSPTARDAHVDYTISGQERKRFGLLIAAVRAFLVAVKLKSQVDVLHVHGFGTTGAALSLAMRILGRPVILGLRSSGKNNDLQRMQTAHGRLAGAMLWRLQLACTRIVCVKSIRMFEEVRQLGADESRLRIVPNGVDLSRLERLSGPETAGRQVAYVGRMLIETKGLDSLHDAWLKFKATACGDEWRLLLVGVGPDEHTVADWAAVEPSIVWCGSLQDVGSVLEQSRALVLPSRCEGFSNALLEGLSAGRPIIATEVSGSEDVVDNDVGWLLPVGDSEGLLSALTELSGLDDDELKAMSERAKRRAAVYSIEAVAAKWLRVYESAWQ